LRTEVGVGGAFGVGKVTSVGEGVQSTKVNSNVLFASDAGAWNDEALVCASRVYDVASLSADKASLVPDVASAWTVMNKFTSLASGDVVVRSTGGSAAFNQTVDFIAKQKGCTIIAVSDAELLDGSLKKKLEGKGAKLAISHHAGKHTRAMNQVIVDGGVMVTHNGAIPALADCDGVEAPVAKLIFNGIKVHGFDFAAMARGDREGCAEAVNAAVALLGADLKVDSKTFTIDKIKEAVERASTGQTSVLSFGK
jgi:NADPH:quinone reductase-like Zn-dependent oxidoreductase